MPQFVLYRLTDGRVISAGYCPDSDLAAQAEINGPEYGVVEIDGPPVDPDAVRVVDGVVVPK
jgi:hypothetical protein